MTLAQYEELEALLIRAEDLVLDSGLLLPQEQEIRQTIRKAIVGVLAGKIPLEGRASGDHLAS